MKRKRNGRYTTTRAQYKEVKKFDHDPEEREKALEMSKQLLERCDEVWVFDENGTSEGMKGEIELASQLGKQVRYR